MNAMIITKEQFDELNSRIEKIFSILTEKSKEVKFDYIDNSDFIRLLKISPRTAQSWRDAKMVRFCQIGAKIYYKLDDVKHFIEGHAFEKLKKEI